LNGIYTIDDLKKYFSTIDSKQLSIILDELQSRSFIVREDKRYIAIAFPQESKQKMYWLSLVSRQK
jgi:hypothetical protein